MTRQEAIMAAAGAIEKQIVLDIGQALSEETSLRVLHELEKIYAVGQIHTLTAQGIDRDQIIKDLIKGD